MAYTTIDDPSAYFQTSLHNGNSSTQAITFDGNSNMQPDWVWIKSRSLAVNHYGYDSVRGVDKRLQQNITNAESDTDTTWFRSFDSNGFTIGSEDNINDTGATFVSWNWKKVAGVFDIVTYAGNNTGSRQVSHNLGVVPSLIIIKNRTNASSWWVGSTEIPFTWNTDYLQLNETAAKGTDGGGHIFGAVPTSSYFVPGDNNDTNGNSNNYVAYLFGNKQGVSKVGSYTGNGNADGTFVYTGFKPAFIMIKKFNAGDGWFMYDNKREGYNQQNNHVMAHSNAVETTGGSVAYIDILSNGFKCRSTNGNINASGDSYITMCFAENPFVTSSGIPATAK